MIKYFHDFYRISDQAYLLLDQSTLEILAVNGASVTLFGFNSQEEVLQKIFTQFCKTEENISDVLSKISNTLEHSFNTEIEQFSGNRFNARIVFSSLENSGKFYIIASITNLLEKDEMEQAMETFEAIYHELPDGIINHSNGVVITCNKSFLKTGKVGVSSIKGLSITTLFSKQDEQKILNHIAEPEKGKFIIVSRESVDGKWHKFVLESFVTMYKNDRIITTIVSDYQLQEDLAKEQLRANLANEANILLEREIEKHKETQRKLETSQEISKSVFNSSIDTIMSSDLENNITEVSPSACYVFQYTREELITLSISDLYADKSELDKIVSALDKDGFYIGEVTNKKKDGSIFTCFLSCAVMRNKKGEHIGFMGISRDISELKKAEQELIKSEKKYRDLFINLGDSLVIVDKDNNIIDLNNEAKKLFEDENCYGRNLLDFVHPDDLEEVEEKSKEFRQRGNIVNVEFRIKSDEIVKYVNLSSTAIYEGNEYIGSRDIIRDITQEREYQELIKQQTYHLQSIFENKSDVVMCTLDSNFLLTAFNSKLYEFSKYHLDVEIEIGMNFMNVLMNAISDKVKPNLKEFYDKVIDGSPIQFEGIINGKGGKQIWLETFLSPIPVEGSSKNDVALMAMDITDKKETELEITKSLQEKEVLLKEVHHRVKNNLQVISSILNLQSSYVKDQKTLDILRESQNRVKSMSFIHESLYRSKDFSQVNFSDYLNNLINNVIHTFLLPDKDVMLETDLGAVNLNLDQAIPCGLILNELLTNAMKYAFVGIKDPTLSIKIAENGNNVSVWVIDNGVGLPKDFKIDETDSLGLQLVQTLTDQLDGTLEMKTEEGTKYLLTFEKMNQPN